MDARTELWFYFIFIAAATMAVLAMHFYLQQKLRDRHDNSLVWFAAGLLIWLIVILIEQKIWPIRAALAAYNKPGVLLSADDTIHKQALENQLAFPAIFRRFLSILNSLAMVLFLSYFREGWQWLNTNIRKLTATPERTALGVGGICISAAVISEGWWLRTETAMSVLVACLLTTGFALTFWRRNIWLMLPVTLAGGLLLVLNQLAMLAQELPAAQWVAALWPPADDLIFRRMLALFILSLNVGALALTWLGENSAPAVEGNSADALQPLARAAVHTLEFREEQGHIVLYLSFAQGEQVVSFNDRELNPAKRRLLFRHALATREHRSLRSSLFNNFTKERGDLIRELNHKLQPLGLTLAPADLFAKGAEAGTYRLAIPPEQIAIDAAAQRLLD